MNYRGKAWTILISLLLAFWFLAYQVYEFTVGIVFMVIK